jgi:ketol-acid reductoisomerase
VPRWCSRGLNVHFNLLDPRADLDVLMIAPRPQPRRSEYQRGGGVLPSRSQRILGRADLGLSYASAIGGGRRHHRDLVQEECETDLFGEQVDCAAAGRTIKGGYETWSKPATRPRWPISNATR